MNYKQNFSSLKSKLIQQKVKKPTVKINKEYTISKVNKQKGEQQKRRQLFQHPAEQFLHGTSTTEAQFKKFVTILYNGLFYSICNLKGPSEEYIRKKSVKLPERKDSHKKFLMLDLDQTLIHSVFTSEKTQVSIKYAQEIFNFNVRPYTYRFLENMSKHYEIYVYTASTDDYAEPIIEYLNTKKRTIAGVLTRKHCMETNNGFKIKDLRIIKNRCLNDIILVDNLVHSFGLQIENGIPILEFTNNKQDVQLIGVQKMLLEAKDYEDVRTYISKKIAIKKVLDFDQGQFLDVSNKNGKSRG